MTGDADIDMVLERLDRVLAARSPELRRSLRSPVAAGHLESLRRAVDPFEVPHEVEALLRWADGQERGPRLPTLNRSGPLLSARASADHYRLLRENVEDWQWSPLWLPIALEGWTQAGVEMTDSSGAVLHVDWGGSDVEIIAPSLAVLLDAAADIIERLGNEPEFDDPGHQEWRDRSRLILQARQEWREWPYDRLIAAEIAGWPAHWRLAAGRAAEPEVPHPPAAPISAVLAGTAGGSEPVTIEGYVTDRALLDGQASGNAVIALDDGTGSVRVLVQPDTDGSYWAGSVGRRVQADVLAGAAAVQQIDAVLDAEPDRRRRAPVGTCLLAVEVRLGVQKGPPGPTRA